MTVTAIASLRSAPRPCRSIAVIVMIWSPSTSSPCSSTAMTRSPSPSSARPSAAPRSTTVRRRTSGCVDPQPSLMLCPSGDSVQHVHACARRLEDARPGPEPGAVRAVEHDVEPGERVALDGGAEMRRRTRRHSPRRHRTSSRRAVDRPGHTCTCGGPRSTRAPARARLRSRPRRRRRACGRRRRSPSPRCRSTGCGSRRRSPRARPARPRRTRSPASAARRATPPGRPPTAARLRARARCRGPDARVSRPTTTRSGRSTRATARPNATTNGVVSSSSASPRTPSVPKRNTRLRRRTTAWSTAEPCGPS